MSLVKWAEREVELACKRENPDWDGESFDYGCSCYQSALKAYKCLLEDEHSGASFGYTRNILIKLLNELPLSAITDEDFFSVEYGSEEFPLESSEYLREHGLKSDIQCLRKSSLFRKETLDGKVSYHDIDRAYCINVEEPSDTFHGAGVEIVDELFPITMPYRPTVDQYKVYVQTFLVDKRNGDFDTRAVLYIETPKGERIDINRYYKEDNGKFVEIDKDEYEHRLEQRLDKLVNKVANHLIWTWIYNSSTDAETERRRKWYDSLNENEQNRIDAAVIELCKPFENPDNYEANTFSVCQALCNEDNDCEQLFEKYPFLMPLKKYLMSILDLYRQDEVLKTE